MPILIAVFLALFLALPATAQLPADPLYGASRPLVGKMGQRLTLHWSAVPLREAVDRLSQSQRLSIWLDRRLDTSLEITLSLQDVPVSEVLQQLAGQASGDYVATGELVYLGPAANVRDLRTLMAIRRELVSQLPSKMKAALQSHTLVASPRLAEPREVIRLLAGRAGLSVVNGEAIPHDVWPARSLPPLPIADQLTLLLAGFDLTWEPDGAGQSIRIVAIEQPVAIRRVYPKRVLAKVPHGVIDNDAVAPGPKDDQVAVTASAEVHSLLSKGRARPPTANRRGVERQVYSLRVEQQPVGSLLMQLAAQLGKSLEVDLQDKAHLDRRVSFEVRKANLDELLKAVGEPAGLDVRVDGDVLRVSVRDRSR